MQMKDESDPILEVNAEPQLDTDETKKEGSKPAKKSRKKKGNIIICSNNWEKSGKHRVRSAQDQLD